MSADCCGHGAAFEHRHETFPSKIPTSDHGRRRDADRIAGCWGRALSAATPVVGAPDIEDVQYRAIGRCGPGALGDRFCQQAF